MYKLTLFKVTVIDTESRKKSIMTTEKSRFLSAQTTEHQRLNIVYKMVVAHI